MFRKKRRSTERASCRRVIAALGSTQDKGSLIMSMSLDHFLAVLNLVVGLTCLYLELRNKSG